jgi:hypothetical protein
MKRLIRLLSLSTGAFAVLVIFGMHSAHAELARLDNGQLVFILGDEDDAAFDGEGDNPFVAIKGAGIRSVGGQLARLAHAPSNHGSQTGSPVSGASIFHGHDEDGIEVNRQVNDPALDHIVTFPASQIVTRPFEFATQSETSAVKVGRDVVVGYNTSAGANVQFFPGVGLAFTQLLFSGFSTSHDGGKTWKSGFVPPVSADAPFTFGDPALATDRRGNIFYASLGTDAQGVDNTLIINKSTDHGTTFGPATVVVVDNGSDKEWMAIGRDPKVFFRDNIYITWTSFQANSSELHLARSVDGGQTFTTKTLFAPVDDGVNSAFIQFSNPVVDESTGRLYVPFLHGGDLDADNIRVLVSDDGGDTFHFLAFNIPGAVDAFAFPNVQPGVLNDCTGGGVRNVLFQGADQGGGRFGLPRYKQATRLITQPHAVAANGVFAFVVNSSTSASFGDPNAGSEIRLVVSANGGKSFRDPVTIARSNAADPHHVHPAISVSPFGHQLTVSYYVQQANQRLRTDVAKILLSGTGRVVFTRTMGLSNTDFDITPSNVVRTPTATTNFDRTITTCYDIGEYQTLARSRFGDTDDIIAAWGDNRKTWTSPPGSPAAGTHAQPDVFSAKVDSDDDDEQ